MKLFNTFTRKLEEFKPLHPPHVGIYSCGPTVYWNQHVGNMYAYIHWDVLVRFLRYLGYNVMWVMNITDVGHMTSDEDAGEDKMEKGAKRERLPVWQLADKYTNQFLESLDELNIKRPDILCRATENIKEQIELIKRIEKNGFTYKTKTGLVFDTAKFPGYAKFGRLKLAKQTAGARVEVDPEKKQPWDFLLWVTNQPKHIMQWDSPWGRGFPGWHIECTAMSNKYLGERFDIHTGGQEHILVHHTNEIAQAFGAFGRETANYWLHNAWLKIKGEKVSKSLGNIYTVADLIEKGFQPLSFRYLVLTSHYRQGLNFDWKALQAGQTALCKLQEKFLNNTLQGDALQGKNNQVNEFKKRFIDYLSDDLNVPKALALAWETVKSDIADDEKRELLLDWDRVIGLGLAQKFKIKNSKLKINKEILSLIKKREELRKQKKWQEADEVRQKIEAEGYLLEDTAEGTRIKKISNS